MKTSLLGSILLFVLAAAAPAFAQLVETNVALAKPASGDTAFGFPASNGNDGLTATFNHADNASPPPNNPFWSVDLQGLFDLTRIEIVDRIGCCDPNRLNGSEIRVLDGLGAQIGSTLLVDGLAAGSPDEAAGTLTFNNGGAGWPGAATIRVDGYTQYFQFSELRAISLQPPVPRNVATGGIARSSGPLWPGTAARNIVDGNATSFAHPEAAAEATLGFTYTIDLFGSYHFERLEIVNRHDCCPERLSNYRVSLHENNGSGQPGPAVWTTDVRTDGTNSGMGGVDTLTASLHAAGAFTGRFIVIENLNNFEYSPQIAEVRALTFDPAPTSLATGKPVTCHDAAGQQVTTWPGFPAGNVTDASFGTFTHPQEQFSNGYYYQIDLGAETVIGSVVLAGRLDGCCPERLTDATLQILDAALTPVLTQPVAGTVTEPFTIATGAVSGRYLRIINSNGASYGPQVGEVQAYPPATSPALFQITSLTTNPATGNGSVTFTSETGATYSLLSSGNLSSWTTLNANIPSDGAVTVEPFHDDALVGAKRRFYKVKRN